MSPPPKLLPFVGEFATDEQLLAVEGKYGL
jgi:hypothetical protein